MRQAEGREVVIVEAVRTPIGRGHKEKGYYKDTHPNALLGKTLHRGHRALGHRRLRGRGRRSPAACSSSASRASTSRATPGCRRACRSRRPARPSTASAAPPSRPSTSPPALIAAGVHDAMIGSGVEHMGHLPFAAGMKTQEDFGVRLHPGADGQAQHRRPGPRRRDDRRPVGDPPLRARRARGALAQARPPGHRGGPLRARDRADDRRRRDVRHRPGNPSRTRASRRCRS